MIDLVKKFQDDLYVILTNAIQDHSHSTMHHLELLSKIYLQLLSKIFFKKLAWYGHSVITCLYFIYVN